MVLNRLEINYFNTSYSLKFLYHCFHVHVYMYMYMYVHVCLSTIAVLRSSLMQLSGLIRKLVTTVLHHFILSYALPGQ
jgi:hypothetical protein